MGTYDKWRSVKPEPRFEAEYNRLAKAIDRYNESTGCMNSDHYDLNSNFVKADGIECPICKNRGTIMTMAFNDNGKPYSGLVRCECMRRRSAIGRMRRCGLGDAISRCTFESFETNEPWQQTLKDKVLNYVENGAKEGHWLYIGGCPGAGKSHLCTAVVGKLIDKYETTYAIWTKMTQELKAVIMDAEAYDEAVRRYQAADVLYIDDLFKPTNRSINSNASDADVRVAFDILNSRYINSAKITIITSEWMLRELDQVDEATSSRIYERCGSGEYVINIKRDDSRNYRYKEIEEI